ncbi:MAG TPA: GspH/FimT family pseudopilin [Candidatus Solibacter sp.]|jgi:type IV fimbrial biogenesis protein FimT|nr:GspH/FimT family pseudopilin [Candidatus Solibacter sp.]
MVSVYGLLKIYPKTGMEMRLMRYGPASQDRFLPLRPAPASIRGFSLIELLVTMAIVLIATAIAIPLVGNAVTQYRLKSAVVSATGAIQTSRYRAISSGYPYRVVFNSTNVTYQVQSDPGSSGTWGNVGGAVPLSTATPITMTLNQDTTLNFKPNGAVTATTGAMNFTLGLTGKTETITVSNYGSITVTP